MFTCILTSKTFLFLFWSLHCVYAMSVVKCSLQAVISGENCRHGQGQCQWSVCNGVPVERLAYAC